MFDHGQRLPNETICNGGVVLVKPNTAVFKLMQSDCGKASPWHVATRCVDSYYIGHAMQFSCLDVSFNFNPIITKGVAHTECWQRLAKSQLMIVHFSSGVKHQDWFTIGQPPHLPLGLGTRGWHESASRVSTSELQRLQDRADSAATTWIKNCCFSLRYAAKYRGIPTLDTSQRAHVKRLQRLLVLYLFNRIPAGAAAIKLLQRYAGAVVLRDAAFFLLRANSVLWA